MDFFTIEQKIRQVGKNDIIEIYPDFKACRSKDLMIRGKSFYAIWDEEKGLWSTDEYDVQRLVDKELEAERKKLQRKYPHKTIVVKWMLNFSSNMWKNYRSFIREMSDNAHQLDNKIIFSNMEVKKTDYVSRKLPYPLEECPIQAYDELINTLYEPEERLKLEWSIGAIISGDAKNIQKFIVLYGESGTGKSTFLNILQKLFDGYYTTFDAKALGSNNNQFATEIFRDNPLVAIQHDGDLSKIEDNTKLNSIIAHEIMAVQEKYKPTYMTKYNAFLFMGTNKPVKITDSKSGIIRRLIDVKPSGKKVPTKRYHVLMNQIDFELSGIAWHCLEVYRKLGKNYYSNYRPLSMIFETDVFFNFVEAYYHTFKEQDGVSLAQAYEMYKSYCDETLIDFKLPRHKFREELKSYFQNFFDITRINNKQIRSYYKGFLTEKFTSIETKKEEERPYALVLDQTKSILDDILKDCQAQYASDNEVPLTKWRNVLTTLKDIDTYKLHYVRPPKNHIVIDFDLKDENGHKSVEKNLEEASKWPLTYAEFSKGGAGIHLHYIYDGDVEKLSRMYDEGIEIKIFTGNSSLRRKLSKCNNIPIATINSGLPLKGDKKMINFKAVNSEKALRRSIEKALRKEVHPNTKPNIDFIKKILDDAYNSGMTYDVTNLRPKILAFANNSTNQADYCLKVVTKMKFKSEEASKNMDEYTNEELIFFDVEVFPNVLIIVWKPQGKSSLTKMFNPTPAEIEELLKFKLVGFNCRRYDNHILYARYIGYDNKQIFDLSQKLVKGSSNCFFSEAYNISYTDVYDFSSVKKSLKKFQIELGIHHKELGIPWDQDLPKERWDEAADYCVNDVVSLEAVFENRKQDFIARLILADLSGLTPNDTTQQHTAKIIFGNDPRPQDKFVYTDLSEMFPGYKFENGVSTYMGEVVGEGGYVHAEPGMYANVAVLDVASMHPTSAIELNVFGPYTKNYAELKEARLAIKHKDFDKAKHMLGGILEKYLTDEKQAKDLAYALKIVINIVYGLTSAKFDSKFRDPRNIDNIVAKRGALFMIKLKNEVQARGYRVIHIKTDSIKIPNADEAIIRFVMDFGKRYGYDFEHETTYEKICLVNDAVYIANIGWTPDGKNIGQWEAVGAQFAHPYVFKTLFSKEPIVFKDLIEAKSVKSALYLDMNENLPDVSEYEKEAESIWKRILSKEDLSSEMVNQMEARLQELNEIFKSGHNYRFIGKVGAFCPVKAGCGGGILLREQDNKYYAATGTKGYRWLEAEMILELKKEGDIDYEYYRRLVDDAIEKISKYGDFEWFVAESDIKMTDNPIGFDDPPPLLLECGKFDCQGCKHWNITHTEDGNIVCDLGHECIPF